MRAALSRAAAAVPSADTAFAPNSTLLVLSCSRSGTEKQTLPIRIFLLNVLWSTTASEYYVGAARLLPTWSSENWCNTVYLWERKHRDRNVTVGTGTAFYALVGSGQFPEPKPGLLPCHCLVGEGTFGPGSRCTAETVCGFKVVVWWQQCNLAARCQSKIAFRITWFESDKDTWSGHFFGIPEGWERNKRGTQ